jgi:tetratricopeptide (TPR) repeat protein
MGSAIALCFLLLQMPDFVDQGIHALDAKQNEEAAVLFRKAIAADPTDYTAHFELALAESLQYHDPEAVSEYQKSLELKPHLYQAELNLGILLLRDKRAADALEPLESAAGQKPAEYRANYYFAEALLASGKLPEAQARFEAALKIHAKSAAAEAGLAEALLRQNQLASAAEHFEAAAEEDPVYRNRLLELAEAYEKSGNPTEAIEIYKKFPDNASAQARLGDLLVDSKQFADAIARLEKAVAESPTVANRLALANAYRLNHESDKQNDQIAKAIAAEPNNYDLRMFSGRTMRDARHFDQAANQFLAATKLKPESKEAWNELAMALIMHEDYGPGLAALDRVKALGELPGDEYVRAITLDKLRQLPLALTSYKTFLAMSEGKYPDEEFLARQRVRIIETELHKR